MNVRDVRMVQRRENLRFAPESCETFGVVRNGRKENLDRDVAIQLRVTRAVDLAHTAGAECGEDFVGAEARSDGQGHPATLILPSGVDDSAVEQVLGS